MVGESSGAGLEILISYAVSRHSSSACCTPSESTRMLPPLVGTCLTNIEQCSQGRDSLPSLPSYSARRQSSSGPCGDDVLVPVSQELASEDGSGMLASTPSGSIYLDPSSPSATARQHCKRPCVKLH